LRLQAEMDNYHKRQQPTTQEQARAGQERILQATEGCTMFSIRNVLVIADNLDRTLAAAAEDTLICRGVALTRDESVRLLQKYDIERIEAQDRPFDPVWHEAVDVVSAADREHPRDLGVEPGVVVHVTQSGYRRGERLLRPARVVAAQ